MFVREKRINGYAYLDLVETVREGGREAVEDQAALGRAVALEHEVLTPTETFDSAFDAAEGFFLVLGEGQDAPKLAGERPWVWGHGVHDGRPSGCWQGSRRISVPP